MRHHHHGKGASHVRDLEDRCRGEDVFEAFKSLLLESCPGPRFPFMSEQVKGYNNVGEVWDEFSVKVCKSGERLDSFD